MNRPIPAPMSLAQIEPDRCQPEPTIHRDTERGRVMMSERHYARLLARIANAESARDSAWQTAEERHQIVIGEIENGAALSRLLDEYRDERADLLTTMSDLRAANGVMQAMVQEAQQSLATERAARQSAELEVEALESWVDIGEATCMECEDRYRVRGSAVCGSCLSDIEHSRELCGSTNVNEEVVS